MYTIHLPEIDAEHRALYRGASELDRAIRAGAGVSELEAIVREIAAHVAEHFAHEERLMRTAGYSSYRWHKEQHDVAQKKVKAYQRKIVRGDQTAAPLLLEYLAGWLGHHIGVSDRMMAAYLRNHARTEAALAS